MVPVAVRVIVAAHEALAGLMPDGLTSVGRWYRDFTQTPDAVVLDLLRTHGSAP